MTDNVRYIVSKLLSLRAGMSLAANEADALAKVEDEYMEADKEYQSNLVTLRESERVLKNCERDIEGERYLLKKRSIRRNLLFLFFFIFALGGGVLYFMEPYRLLGYACFAIAVIFPFIVSFIIVPKGKNYKKPNKRLIRDLEKECVKLKKSIKESNIKLKQLRPQHDKNERVYENERTYRTLNVKDIYGALYEQHSKLLPTDYWKYVDIMFYYFEAKKCDSIEVCRALIDRLVQSEFLESSSVKATHNLNLRFSKLVSASRLYLEQELATVGLKIERRNANFSGIVQENKLYSDLKARLGLNSQLLYENMVKLITIA
ncbi:MAG: hypothetical protein IJW19_08705 [Clostridia bacterium]|nr:hypothetical protein [Clostridia bacterium]